MNPVRMQTFSPNNLATLRYKMVLECLWLQLVVKVKPSTQIIRDIRSITSDFTVNIMPFFKKNPVPPQPMDGNWGTCDKKNNAQ